MQVKIPKIVLAATNLELADCELLNNRKAHIRKKQSKNSIYASKYGKTPPPDLHSYPNSPSLSNPGNPASENNTPNSNITKPVIKP